MKDFRDKIKKIIEQEKEKGNFSVLDLELSVDLIQQILENYEVTNELTQATSDEQKNAELIFVAAPTGAGKDSLVTRLNYKNPDKKYIELNIDIFRHYFTLFLKDKKNLNDKNFAIMTNQFSYEIFATIQEILLQEFSGINIIITGTLRDTDWVEEVFEKFKNNKNTNYDVKLICLAVPKKESAISIIKRYVSIVDSESDRLKQAPGTARYTTMKYHDETFEKFPRSFEYFEKKFLEEPGKLIDTIEVYKRSKDIKDISEKVMVYSSNEDDSEKTASEVCMELRNKDYKISFNEFNKIAKKIMKNKEYLKEQGTLREIIRDLAVILDYPKVVEKLDEMEVNSNEHNL